MLLLGALLSVIHAFVSRQPSRYFAAGYTGVVIVSILSHGSSRYSLEDQLWESCNLLVRSIVNSGRLSVGTVPSTYPIVGTIDKRYSAAG
jgi:hypothetical protein